MNTPKFSQETVTLLSHWFTNGADVSIKDVTPLVISDLAQYKPSQKVLLYRGVLEEDKIDEKEHIIEFKELSSWTHSKEMACNFSDTVISMYVYPEDIFFDSTLISKNYIIKKLSGFPEEKEVILNPGLYKYFDYYSFVDLEDLLN